MRVPLFAAARACAVLSLVSLVGCVGMVPANREPPLAMEVSPVLVGQPAADSAEYTFPAPVEQALRDGKFSDGDARLLVSGMCRFIEQRHRATRPETRVVDVNISVPVPAEKAETVKDFIELGRDSEVTSVFGDPEAVGGVVRVPIVSADIAVGLEAVRGVPQPVLRVWLGNPYAKAARRVRGTVSVLDAHDAVLVRREIVTETVIPPRHVRYDIYRIELPPEQVDAATKIVSEWYEVELEDGTVVSRDAPPPGR